MNWNEPSCSNPVTPSNSITWPQAIDGRSLWRSRADEWFNERYVIPANGFSIEEAMMRLIKHALEQTGDNLSAAARLLGVPRDYLRYRLDKH